MGFLNSAGSYRLQPLRVAAAILFLCVLQMVAPVARADDYSQSAVVTTLAPDNQVGICNGQYNSPDAGMAGCASEFPWCNSVGTGGGTAPGDCHPTSGTIYWHYLSGFSVNTIDNDREVWTANGSYQACAVGGSCSTGSYDAPIYVYANCPVGQIGASFHDSFGNNAPYSCFVRYTGQNLTPPPCGANQDSVSGQCYNKDRNTGKKCDCVGNPMDPSSGNKYQSFTDYKGGGPFPLVFARSYNSIAANESTGTDSLGSGWTSGVLAHLSILIPPGAYYTCIDDGSGYTGTGTDPNQGVEFICFTGVNQVTGSVTVWDADGGQQVFTATFEYGSPTTSFTPVPGSSGTLVGGSGGFVYTSTDGTKETFTGYGRLQSVTDPHGLTQTYTYTYSGYFLQSISVSDPAGRAMVVNYDSTTHRIASVTVPAFNSTAGTAIINFGVNNTSGNLETVTYQDGSVVTYEYNDSSHPHALTGLKDETLTEYAAWGYDGSGDVICSEHGPTVANCSSDIGGVDKTTVTYNADGSADVTEATGLVRHMTFTNLDGSNQLHTVDRRCLDCGDLNHIITYDAAGHVATVTDFNGNETDYQIDAIGLERSRTEAVSGGQSRRTTITNWYTPSGGVEEGLPASVTEQDASGAPVRVTTFCYNASCDGSPITGIWTKSVTDPVNTGVGVRTTAYTYSGGVLSSMDGPLTGLSDVTNYTYYPSVGCPSGGIGRPNDLCKITDSLGHSTKVTQYSAAGLPLSITDANNVITTFTYDARGRLGSRTVDAGGSGAMANAKTTWSYYPNGLLYTVALPITAPGHAYMTYYYDNARRLIKVQDDLGEVRTYTYTYDTGAETYDIEEQRFAYSGGEAVYDHHITRDDLDDRVVETDGLGNQTIYKHDPNGNVTTVTDALQHATTNYYDALNRVYETQDPNSATVNYLRDTLDRVTYVTTGPRGANTGYIYDAFGELLSQSSPDSGLTTYDYGSWLSSATVKKRDARGVLTTYNFDSLGRLTAASYPDTTRNVAYTFDQGLYGIGRLSGVSDSSGSTSYSYDSHGNKTQKIVTMHTHVFTVGYRYDGADDLAGMTYPDGMQVNYVLDALGRTSEVDARGTAAVSTVNYEPFGPTSGMTFGNGLSEVRDYYPETYWLKDLATSSGQSSIQSWTYSYNHDGTVSGIADNNTSGDSQSFTYDPVQRLVTASGAYGSLTIGSDPLNHPELSYDADGNRTQITELGSTTLYTYDPAGNRLLTAGSQNYRYDAMGDISNDDSHSYNYDVTGRLTGFDTIAGAYVYNGLGQRSLKNLTPPMVTISAPIGGGRVRGSIPLSATASDGVGVASLQFQVDGTNVGPLLISAPYSITWNSTGWDDGSHVITAIVFDATGDSNTSAAVSVTVDNTLPAVAITEPVGGSDLTGTVTISATASDTSGIQKVQFQVDGVSVGTAVTSAPYAVSWDTGPASTGAHSLTAIAYDAVGNQATSATVMVNVDHQSPAVAVTAPVNGSDVTGTAVTISATASDDINISSVQFLVDGVPLTGQANVNGSTYSIDWNGTPNIAPGSHTITAVATDEVGNTTTSAPVAVTAQDIAPGLSAGVIYGSINTPINGTFAVTRQYSTQAVSFQLLSAPQGSLTNVNLSTGTYIYTPPQGYAGRDSFTFKVTDQFGSAAQATVNVYIGDVAPIAYDWSVTIAQNYSESSDSLHATTGANGPLTYEMVTGPQNGSASVMSAGGFTYIPYKNYVGTDSFTFKATDQYGGVSNIATESIVITGPVLSLSPSDHDFGSQYDGTSSAAFIFTLSNSGTGPAQGPHITSTGFAHTNNCGDVLSAGASCTISTTFSPSTQIGAVSGALDVTFSNFNGTLQANLTGTGLATIIPSLSPSTIDFGAVARGKLKKQNIILRNSGTGNLTVTNITGPAVPFSETNNCGGLISPGGECQITVSFAPTAIGTFSATITITDDATDGSSPQTITLSGTGQ